MTRLVAAAKVKNSADARNDTARNSLDLLAGPAFPMGSFASGDQTNVANGPIKTGGLVELGGTYHLNHRFGIVLAGEGQTNRVKEKPAYVPITDNYGIVPPPPPYEYNWKIARILTGGVYTIPLDKNQKLNLLVRMLGGVQKTKTAGWERPTAEQAKTLGPSLARTLPWTFSYEGDLGLKWHPCGRLAFIAYGGYNASPLKVNAAYYTDPFGNALPDYLATQRKSSFPTSSLLFRAGASLDL